MDLKPAELTCAFDTAELLHGVLVAVPQNKPRRDWQCIEQGAARAEVRVAQGVTATELQRHNA